MASQRKMHHENQKQMRMQERKRQQKIESSTPSLVNKSDYNTHHQQQQNLSFLGRQKQGGTSDRRQHYRNSTDTTNTLVRKTLNKDNSYRSSNSSQSRRSRSFTSQSIKSGWSNKSSKSNRSINSGKSNRSINSGVAGPKRFSGILKPMAKDSQKEHTCGNNSNASSATACASLSTVFTPPLGQREQDNSLPCAVTGGISESWSFDDMSSYHSSNFSCDGNENSCSDSCFTSSSSVRMVSVAEAVQCLNQEKKRRGLWQRR